MTNSWQKSHCHTETEETNNVITNQGRVFLLLDLGFFLIKAPDQIWGCRFSACDISEIHSILNNLSEVGINKITSRKIQIE